MNEALADPHHQDDFDDELSGEPDATGRASQKMLIAPRLSLQSKQMPAVHIVPDSRVRPQPAAPLPETNHGEAQPAAPKKKRLAGHTTRVRLQAVPKTEKRSAKKTTSSPGIVDSTIVERPEQPAPAGVLPEYLAEEHVTEKSIVLSLNKDERPAREKLSGSGQFQRGQSELTVQNAHVSASSVVMVNLLGNPGPVVVQYYTLLPDYGFKVHLSAPVTTDTQFNYVILLGELF